MKPEHLMRRVAGWHDIRMDGISDLVLRARGSSVFDIGCNRGLVAFEFANNGARLCHGCDLFPEGIETARQIFADLRNVESQFEVVDLTEGPRALKPFGSGQYDIVLMLATYHKLKRIMPADELKALMLHFGRGTRKYFGWRATSEDAEDNNTEMLTLDRDLGACKLRRVHTSYISDLGVAAIWERE